MKEFFKKIRILQILLVLGLFIFQNPFADAAGKPTVVVLYTHTNDALVANAARNSYSGLGSAPTIQFINKDIYGFGSGDVRNSLRSIIDANGTDKNYLVTFAGHGDPGKYAGDPNGQFIDGVNFNRQQGIQTIDSVFTEKGVRGSVGIDSCGAGNSCVGLPNLQSIDAVFPSTYPNTKWDQIQYYPGVAGSEKNLFPEQIKSALKDFKADTNKDGIVTAKELDTAVWGSNSPSKIQNPDAPVFFKDAETADRYFGKKQETLVVASEYVYDEQTGGFIVIGKLPSETDTVKVISEPKRKDLAYNEAIFNKKSVSLGSVAEVGTGEYRVGKNCKVNYAAPGGSKGVILPELKEEAFKECDKPKEIPLQNPNSNWNLGGTGSNLNGAAGAGAGGLGSMMGAGGLNSILPLLMSGLLGGGQGQGGYGQQNPYGAGYNQQQQNCASIAQSPVCGADGKTYNNACYLRQAGIAIKNQGVCVQATPTPTSISNISSILNQVSQSGIPSSIIESVKNVVASILSTVPAGITVVK